MTLADTLVRLDGLRPCGGGYIARCPAHTDREASLSIREGESGKVLFKCFAGCSFQAIRDALGGEPRPRIPGPPAPTPRLAPDNAKRTEIARRIWRESRPAPGTLVETYLRSRGIMIPVPPSLRFHPSLRHPAGAYLPAMVAAVSDLNRNVLAVHRTYLDGQGSKTMVEPPKAAIGPITGHAVHLAQAAETLALAEGIETALTVQQASGIATWAALGTANLRRVELPDCVREAIICADNDVSGAGEKAALAAAAKFTHEGRRVRIARPPVAGMDFNDLLRT